MCEERGRRRERNNNCTTTTAHTLHNIHKRAAHAVAPFLSHDGRGERGLYIAMQVIGTQGTLAQPDRDDCGELGGECLLLSLSLCATLCIDSLPLLSQSHEFAVAYFLLCYNYRFIPAPIRHRVCVTVSSRNGGGRASCK